ncbi:hypothetical protein ABE65_020560 [Fictibacillus phosphorivorans]|uniref:Uncharacterized protein n=1 Tax=Fictibacillus phosphorivorans TaxID=1221500 RepID=A0A160IRE7_9BACL|nr:hypothetical protein [Fictibacillus phosphorivorans]ANC79064.1 hypothetical protein ABE65_020560 [Fictibacillus phosphorivorans]
MKKILFFSLVTLFVGGLVYQFFFNQHISASLSVKKEAIKDKDILSDKRAVLYFSTTADQDMDGRGISLAVFINDKGEADAFKMNGLELGSVAAGNNEVLLVDRDKIRLVGDTYKEFNMKKSQYTGERTGYLEKENLFFTLFNSGFNSNGGYDSNILYGNEKGFHKDNIPYYIGTSGVDKDEIIALTENIEASEYFLRKITPSKNNMEIQDIIQIEKPKNSSLSGSSPILADNQYYYMVLESTPENGVSNILNSDVILYRINKKTLQQDEFTISTYRNEKNLTAHYPFNIKNSAHLYNDILYYANGLGEVFAFDTKTQEMTKKFTMKNVRKDGVRFHEQLFYKDDNLYVVRHDAKLKEKYYIEHYSLTKGKKIENIKINGLNDILQSIKGKSIYSYDFKMLK